MTAPRWYTYAQTLVGIKEVPGPGNNRTIQGWLGKMGAWWNDDATPWCGVYCAHVMQHHGLPYPAAWFRAKAWESYGARLLPSRLALGAILVFERQGGGHVGLYAGEDATAYRVLGGNQGDAVSYTWIAKSRLVASRWPRGEPVTGGRVIMTRDGKLSTNEA